MRNVCLAVIACCFLLAACDANLQRFKIGDEWDSGAPDAQVTGGAMPGTGGSEPGTGGTMPGTGGSGPDTGGTMPGTGGEMGDATVPDCDGATIYLDADGDGFGLTDAVMTGCPGGDYVELAGDCDDGDHRRNPDADEVCNSIDDNCDGTIDEGCECATDATKACGELDGAGGIVTLGECAAGVQTCESNLWGSCVGADLPVTETCNDLDDNCDGTKDEGLTITVYRDADGDGFGRADESSEACTALDGYSETPGDCNDGDPAIHPSATEACDGLDNDCDGETDTGCSCEIEDSQPCGSRGGDGQLLTIGQCVPGAQPCEGGTFGSCVGATLSVPEICNGDDDNCDGFTDEGVTLRCWPDGDEDSFAAADAVGVDSCDAVCPAASTATEPVGSDIDCVDDDATIFPTQTETCNGLDDDCDGVVDNDVTTTYYTDSDSDGFGDPLTASEACSQPANTVELGGDCQDGNVDVYPGQTESCDGVDEDCNDLIDDGITCSCTNGDDRDCGPTNSSGQNETRGRCQTGTEDCSNGSWEGTCNNAVYPVTETCNGFDDDCNGNTDESPLVDCWVDGDGDGFAVLNSPSTQVCGACGNGQTSSQPTAGRADCNDAANNIHPDVGEACNGIDDNCNGSVDEGVKTTFYEDLDRDTYGNSSVSEQTCTPSQGFVAQSGDCNDASNTVYPGRGEICNDIDDNCDTQIDNGISCSCINGDERDCGPNTTRGICRTDTQTCVDGLWPTTCPGAVYPTSETCNGLDDNCDGTIDDAVKSTYYQDNDADTFGSSSNILQACTQPANYVTNSTDCDDGNGNINPSVTETCNGIDDNCIAGVDENNPGGGASCGSNTGICVAGSLQCTNGNLICQGEVTASNNDATCNDLDDDCDGTKDENVTGKGDVCTVGTGRCENTGTLVCNNAETGLVCSVTAGSATTESCNGIDDDCDGATDEDIPAYCQGQTLRYCAGGGLASQGCADSGDSCVFDENSGNSSCTGDCADGDLRCSSRTQTQECEDGVWTDYIVCIETGTSPQICEDDSGATGYGTCVPNDPYFVGRALAAGGEYASRNAHLLAQPIDILEDATLVGFGLRTVPVPGAVEDASAYVSLYTDSSGQPGTILSRTDVFEIAYGAGNLTPNAFPFSLTAGTRYWIVAKIREPANTDVRLYVNNATTAGNFRAGLQAFAVPINLSPGDTTEVTGEISLYIRVQK